ncbi:MAG: SUF system NifU family Fe-S cluster assembly protein [Deltaproteobacteria bacterium]|nr:SUF system NifU family Fe-S cluster assembly protein [Deltaproteobacteria bacterium]MBN2671082.1 SUF system NifU family Fe-S cluster assembly protein [Deltaproteobacteria bacterium]
MNLDALYREVIMAHHQHPAGRDPLPEVSASAHGYNPSCGDEFEVNIHVEDGRIAGIQVDGHGCAISQAAGSMLSQVAVGLKVELLEDLIDAFRSMLKTGEPDSTLPGDLPVLSGVSQFPVRIKCASLPMTTTLEAIAKL